MRRPTSAGSVALLLFGSGTCALIYQVAWLRELRLVLGASTAATAAVLAIFMGGLGVGGALLGRRADRHPNPLRMYAHLELTISACAAVTPFLLLAVRHAYVALGGTLALGTAVATCARLVLSALVLGVPTILMGGTLPAASKAVEVQHDVGRRRLALLYGLNTLGAVTGAVLSTFFMLEIFGTRNTLWLACLVNGLIGMGARALARGWSAEPVAAAGPGQERAADQALSAAAPAAFVYGAAGVTGVAFFVMELVWYRMLGPLLGGSTYTFGLILAVALLGIGLGGGLYAMRQATLRPTLRLFALTCGLEAAFIALPFALGDRVAIYAALLQPLGALGLGGKVTAWFAVCALVVLPAALVSGFQFPLMVGLLGRGGEGVGRHVGVAYAWNTAGAIVGSLAGGFMLVPGFGAIGTWRMVVVVLVGLGASTWLISLVREARRAPLAVSAGVLVLAIALVTGGGPTAAWRQSAIGAGRVELGVMGANEIRDWMHGQRRATVWQTDGVESSIGLSGVNGLAFILNGKVDGNARWDAPTQVMLAMVIAALHPQPRTAMVLGLGTGSSAGWLAEVGSIERVDVAEIEPGILEVARRCAPVNHNVMEHPKVRVYVTDGREMLLTSRSSYDLIASAPSNPYRAGIASLYTVEFYRAVAARLAPGGMFSQWVQAYEVDTRTVRTICTTLASVFPVVEIWQTKSDDMLLVCSMEERVLDVPRLRRTLASEPFRAALRDVWGATDLEGFVARFVASSALTRGVAEEDRAQGWINTDDRMLVEFGFARTVGKRRVFSLVDVRLAAEARGQHRPRVVGGEVDWERVEDNRLMMFPLDRQPVPEATVGFVPRRHRVRAVNRFLAGDLGAVADAWSRQPRDPEYPLELVVVAEALADSGDARAAALIERLGAVWPADADAVRARYRWRLGDREAAVEALEAAFTKLRHDPWPELLVLERALGLAEEIATQDRSSAERLFRALAEPFSVRVLEEARLRTLLSVARRIDAEHAAEAVHEFEPHVPWTRVFLGYRLATYQRVGDPLAEAAERELEQFMEEDPVLFSETLH